MLAFPAEPSLTPEGRKNQFVARFDDWIAPVWEGAPHGIGGGLVLLGIDKVDLKLAIDAGLPPNGQYGSGLKLLVEFDDCESARRLVGLLIRPLDYL